MISRLQSAFRPKLEENMEAVTSVDEIYKYDKKQQMEILQAKPWEKEPNYFQNVKISAIALMKMIIHARSGGRKEIMGLMLGKVDGPNMIVMDSFALPVEGTETRVNAQAQAYEYMVKYTDAVKSVGRPENVIGWYHSHPDYGCWLSGIDCDTQMQNQQYQDPYLAIVVDPIKTQTTGKVHLGAFRTYPKGFRTQDDSVQEYQSIPLNKIEDFGVHCKQYYQLEVTYFKSSLDQHLLESLWNLYWSNILATSPLLTNEEHVTSQLMDIADKLEQVDNAAGRSDGPFLADKAGADKMAKAVTDCCKFGAEMSQCMMTQSVKRSIFGNL